MITGEHTVAIVDGGRDGTRMRIWRLCVDKFERY